MESSKKEDIALHRSAKRAIFYKKLNITLRFAYCTIKRFTEDSNFKDRKRTSRTRTVRTPTIIRTVKARIQRNPVKQKILALQMGLSRTTVKRVMNEDLGLRAYRKQTGHFFNERVKKIRLDRSDALLRQYAGKKYREILFSDEKFLKSKKNKQNDNVYGPQQ